MGKLDDVEEEFRLCLSFFQVLAQIIEVRSEKDDELKILSIFLKRFCDILQL
jgi:hypothetical protein